MIITLPNANIAPTKRPSHPKQKLIFQTPSVSGAELVYLYSVCILRFLKTPSDLYTERLRKLQNPRPMDILQ